MAVRDELHENLSEFTDACADEPALTCRIRALGRFLDAFLTVHETMLDDRARHGLIREVHGDLRAEHVILAPRLGIVALRPMWLPWTVRVRRSRARPSRSRRRGRLRAWVISGRCD